MSIDKSNMAGAAFGSLTVLVNKIYHGFVAETSALLPSAITWPDVEKTLILSAVGGISGFVATTFIKWLFRTAKKKLKGD